MTQLQLFDPGGGFAAWWIQSICGISLLILTVSVLSRLAGPARPAFRDQLWIHCLLSTLVLPLAIAAFHAHGWTLLSFDFVRENSSPSSLYSEPITARDLEPVNQTDAGTGFDSVAMRKDRKDASTTFHLPKSSIETKHSGGLPASQGDRQSSLASLSLATFPVVLWLAGTGILLLRLMVDYVRLLRLKREAKLVDARSYAPEMAAVERIFGHRKLPLIKVSKSIPLPVVAGFVNPAVIFPVGLVDRLSGRAWTEAFVHECAHIIRQDPWILLLQRFAVALFWPNPLIHWMSRELGRAREEACDNFVLAASKAEDYAETLLQLANDCLPAPHAGAELAMLQGKHELICRIESLLDRDRDRRTDLGRAVQSAIVLACLVLIAFLSIVQIHSEPSLSNAEEVTRVPRIVPKAPGPAVSTREDEQNQISTLVETLLRYESRKEVNQWAVTIRDLVKIGKPAVPALTKALDETQSQFSIRLLAFTLRAIGDGSSIPALIRALPRTSTTEVYDYLLTVPDPTLFALMEANDLYRKSQFKQSSVNKRSEFKQFTLGSPACEVDEALRQLSGKSFGGNDLQPMLLVRSEQQKKAKSHAYYETAQRWAAWWEQNWKLFTKNAALREVRLPAELEITVPNPFPTGPTVKVEDGWFSVCVTPVQLAEDPSFRDLDIHRFLRRPESFPKDGSASIDALTSWAAREGADVMGVMLHPRDSGKVYYGVRGVGLQAWEIAGWRWDTIENELQSEQPLELGTLAGDLLVHFDKEHSVFEPDKKATFLFITREGTAGILRVISQITRKTTNAEALDERFANLPRMSPELMKRYGLLPPGPVVNRDNNEFQDKDVEGPHLGVMIEYKLFFDSHGDSDPRRIK